MPGDTSETVSIAILGDTIDEADETLTLTLSNPSANLTLGALTPGTGTIVDDDNAPTISANSLAAPRPRAA